MDAVNDIIAAPTANDSDAELISNSDAMAVISVMVVLSDHGDVDPAVTVEIFDNVVAQVADTQQMQNSSASELESQLQTISAITETTDYVSLQQLDVILGDCSCESNGFYNAC